MSSHNVTAYCFRVSEGVRDFSRATLSSYIITYVLSLLPHSVRNKSRVTPTLKERGLGKGMNIRKWITERLL